MIPQFYTFLRYTSSRKLERTIHTQSTSMEQRSWNDQKLLTTSYAFAYADKPAAENTDWETASESAAIFAFHLWRKNPLSVKHSLTVTVTKLDVTSVMKIWSIRGFLQHLQLSCGKVLVECSLGLGEQTQDEFTVISDTSISPLRRSLFCVGVLMYAASQPLITAIAWFSPLSLRKPLPDLKGFTWPLLPMSVTGQALKGFSPFIFSVICFNSPLVLTSPSLRPSRRFWEGTFLFSCSADSR